ncbi:pentatricopeptide repeat-containing protein, partial [Tanacetum coccineum]
MTKAQELFNEIRDRNLVSDSGVYYALTNAYIRSGNVMLATRVINEMEENSILSDNVTFHTICLIDMGDEVKLKMLDKMIKKLQIAVPVSRDHAKGSANRPASERKTEPSHWLRNASEAFHAIVVAPESK